MDRSVERTRGGDEPRIDPRYDPIYQRGYAAGADQRPRSPEPRLRRRTPPPAPVDSRTPPPAPPDASAAGAPFVREPDGPLDARLPAAQEEPAEDAPRDRRRWAVLLAVASGALIIAGAWAFLASWPLQYQSWSVVGSEVRTPDGLSMIHVQLSQLALTVAPQLIVLGVAGLLADLAILALGPARGRR